MLREKKVDRAKQFLAFSPLKGYYELILEKQKRYEEKVILSEEYEEYLYYEINKVKNGDLLDICYYEGVYKNISGLVSEINFYEKYLILVKIKINFEDIYDLKRKNKNY